MNPMTREDWERVLEEHHLASFRWALTCCRRDREEARDVLQTVYLNVLAGRAQFNGDASPTTWLFSVIRRTAMGRRRGGLVRGILLGQSRGAGPIRRRRPTRAPGSRPRSGPRACGG